MASSAYFVNGLQHFVAGGFWALLFQQVSGTAYLKKTSYLTALVVSSSALFFLPAHIGRYGSLADQLYQFLHYPLADWDILLFGMPWHRLFLTHSLIIPALVLIFGLRHAVGHPVGMGLSIGMSSHLVWDALTCSLYTPIVFIDQSVEMRGYPAKGWLILHGLLLFAFAWHVSRKIKPADAGHPARLRHEENT